MTKRIPIIFTGGTISMTDAGSGPAPRLRGADLMQWSVDDAGPSIVIDDWGAIPGSHLTFSDIVDIGSRIAAHCASPDTLGVVIVQGTDTIEETSMAWDLMGPWQRPVVVTGAMRHAGQPDSDGKRNLADAVRWIAALASTPGGVFVAFAGQLFPAASVVKRDSVDLAAFVSPNADPMGEIDSNTWSLSVVPSPIGVRATDLADDVELVLLGLGTPARTVARALESGPRGVVICAPGRGHTSPGVLEVGRQFVGAGGRLVIASRCYHGVAGADYGFPGGGRSWQDAGALFAHDVSAVKARVALAAAIGSGLTPARTQELLDDISRASS